MVRVPHHDPEHGGSIFLTTLSLSMGRRIRVEDSRAAREKSTSGGVLGRYVGATPLGVGMIPAALERNYPKRLLTADRWHMILFQQAVRRGCHG